jgi:hypothetical protein
MAGHSIPPVIDDTTSVSEPPYRQIRAFYTDATVTVYQAYSSEIATRAIAAQRFVPPFKFSRMTWIKASFLWMMYRSGWATKQGQERILAIEITRAGFQWCLDNSCLTHFDPEIHSSKSEWMRAADASPVRVQWDPERSVRLDRMSYRSIQIGLAGEAVLRYVEDWAVQISDITSLARDIHGLVDCGDDSNAKILLPKERPLTVIAPHLGLK